MKIHIDLTIDDVAEILEKEPHELDNFMGVEYNYTTNDWLKALSEELSASLENTLRNSPNIIEAAMWRV